MLLGEAGGSGGGAIVGGGRVDKDEACRRLDGEGGTELRSGAMPRAAIDVDGAGISTGSAGIGQ